MAGGPKLAIMSDVHANLPALQAALGAIQQEGCDAIYHCGDAVGIGPFPAECLDLMLNTPRMHQASGALRRRGAAARIRYPSRARPRPHTADLLRSLKQAPVAVVIESVAAGVSALRKWGPTSPRCRFHRWE